MASTNNIIEKGKQLAKMLQENHKGFAYQMLALEIEVENNKDQKDPRFMNILSRLIQLYMIGVQVLESNADKRYRYFNSKIQALMKKKHIVQELHMASTGRRATKQALVEVRKQERGVRKNEHDIQVFLNAEQCDIKKIKQLIQKEEDKFKTYQSKMQSGLREQQDRINNRIKMRRMKSQCFSPRKFDIDLGSNPPQKKQRETMNEEVFGVFGGGKRKNLANDQIKRKGSIQKDKTAKIQI